MIENGGLEEIKYLYSLNLSPDNQLMNAIGIRQFQSYFDGTNDLKTCIETAKTATRNYAKRQITYIKNQLSPELSITNILQINDEFINNLVKKLNIQNTKPNPPQCF
jgi:tRNA dimethylallyltransferase